MSEISNLDDARHSDRWRQWRAEIDLEKYDRRWQAMANRGESVHGEVEFLERFLQSGDGATFNVLDAGCGTGRVALEIKQRHPSFTLTGVDLDAEMIDRAQAKSREKNIDITWHVDDLSTLETLRGQKFDLIVLAGNIFLFCREGTQAHIVKALANVLKPGGRLVIGWSQEHDKPENNHRSYRAADLDRDAGEAGLTTMEKFSTWTGEVFKDGSGAGIAPEHSDYCVHVTTK